MLGYILLYGRRVDRITRLARPSVAYWLENKNVENEKRVDVPEEN